MSAKKNLKIPAENKSRMPLVIGIIVVAITFGVFYPVTGLGWTNWDDDLYVYENQDVIKGNMKNIFTTSVNNNYNPLPIMTHAMEWKKVKDEPFLYHFNNLWMHALCTLLVFIFFLKLKLKPLAAGAAALLFGIHPLRVESVAWITERKDMMFGAFYVGALIFYLDYLRTKKNKFLIFTGVLFIFSLFSKIQAVSLPLSLLAIDWYAKRPMKAKVLLEKVPFFLGALGVGLLGVFLLKEGDALDLTKSYAFYERVIFGMFGYVNYIIKTVIPFETCTFYPYPVKPLWYHYAAIPAIIGLGVAAFYSLRKTRVIMFGLAFFTVNIMFLLQIIGAGSAFMADRFSYISGLGLIFIIAVGLHYLIKEKSKYLPVAGAVVGLWLIAMVVLTSKYIPAWENSETLWTDVIEKHPRKVVLAYVNRGHYLRREGKADKAFEDFNIAIQLKDDWHLGYLNRGNIYFDRGQDDLALADYTRCIELNPDLYGAYTNRGAIYARKGMNERAMADFSKAIEINASNKTVFSNRAVLYSLQGNNQAAIDDYSTFLTLSPRDASVLNDRGVGYLRLNKPQEAMNDFNAAIQVDGSVGAYFMNRSYAFKGQNKYSEALADALQAQKLGYTVNPEYLSSLQTN